jgi:MFS family permease
MSESSVHPSTHLSSSSMHSGDGYTFLIIQKVSDKSGRKRILIASIIFGGISSFSLGLQSIIIIPLGLATSFGLACAARVLAGTFGANSTIAKGRIGEISNPTDRAWSYSMYIIMHQVGQIIGPPLGGLLYNSKLKTEEFSYPFLKVCGLGEY